MLENTQISRASGYLIYNYYSSYLEQSNLEITDGLCNNLSFELIEIISVLSSIHDPTHIHEFLLTCPELWLVPSLPHLFLLPSDSIRSSVLIFFSSILKLLNSNPTRTTQKAFSEIYNVLLSWNGVLPKVLRVVSNSHTSMSASLFSSALELISEISEYTCKSESSHLDQMTSTLLLLLQNTSDSLTNLCKISRTLLFLIPSSISTFREHEGIDFTIKLIIYQVNTYENSWECQEKSSLIKTLLEIITVALSKWSSVQGVSYSQIRLIFESGLIHTLNLVFFHKRFEVYPEILGFFNQILTESPSCVSDLVSEGAISQLLESMTIFIPSNPIFIERLLKLMRIVGYNADATREIENNNTLSRIIISLVQCNPTEFNNNIAVSLGENLLDFLNIVPYAAEKAINGCIAVTDSLKNFNFVSGRPEVFFEQVNNFGRIFELTFAFTSEIVIGFLNWGCFEDILDVIRLPVLPLGNINEFHGLGACLKSLPASMSASILWKIFQSITQLISKIQDIAGDLYRHVDFSLLSLDAYQQVLQTVICIDSHVEFLRVVLVHSTVVPNYYDEFIECIGKLGVLLKVLIAEHGNVADFSQNIIKNTEEFGENFEVEGCKNYLEGFFTICETSILKLLRAATKFSNKKSKQDAGDCFIISVFKTIGDILTMLLGDSSVSDSDQKKNYLRLSEIHFISKFLFYEQSWNSANIYAFACAGGISKVFEVLESLNITYWNLIKSEKLEDFKRNNSPVFNSLQILWNCIGRFCENLVCGKYSSLQKDQEILELLGCMSIDYFIKQLQFFVFKSLKKLCLFDSDFVPSAFLRFQLNIFKHLISFYDYISCENIQISGDFEEDINFLEERSETISPLEIEPMQLKIEYICKILISSLPKSLGFIGLVEDILLKICNMLTKEEYEEIIKTIIHLALKITKSLDNVEISYISSIEMKSKQLVPVFKVLNTLLKGAKALEIVSHFNLTSSLFNILEKALDLPGIGDLHGGLLILLSNNHIIRGINHEKLLETLIAILEVIATNDNYIANALLIQGIFQILSILLYNPALSLIFLQSGSLPKILQLKLPSNSLVSQEILDNSEIVLRYACESPYILQAQYKLQFLKLLSQSKINLEGFLSCFKKEGTRSKEIFLSAFYNSCLLIENGGLCVVKKQFTSESVCEKWDSVNTILITMISMMKASKSLCADYSYVFNPERILKILTNIFRKNQLLAIDFIFSCSQEPCSTFIFDMLLMHLISLENNEFLYVNSISGITVPKEESENWLHSFSDLLRALLLSENAQGCQKQDLIPSKFIISELQRAFNASSNEDWNSDIQKVSLVMSATQVFTLLLAPPACLSAKEILLGLSLSDSLSHLKLECTNRSLVLASLLEFLELLTRKENIYIEIKENQVALKEESSHNESESEAREQYSQSRSECIEEAENSESNEDMDEDDEEDEEEEEEESVEESYDIEENNNSGSIVEEISSERAGKHIKISRENLEEFENECKEELAAECSEEAEIIREIYAIICEEFKEESESYSSDIEGNLCGVSYLRNSNRRGSDSIDNIDFDEIMKRRPLDDNIKPHGFIEKYQFGEENKEKLLPETYPRISTDFISCESVKKKIPILKQSLEFTKDEQTQISPYQSSKLPSFEEETYILEMLFQCFSLSPAVSSNILASLLLNFSDSPHNCNRIVDGLVSFLSPSIPLANSPLFSSLLFPQIDIFSSLKVISTLQHMIALDPKVSLTLLSSPSAQLAFSAVLNPHKTPGLIILLQLFQQKLYQSSTLHLTSLISLIVSIISKLGVKVPNIPQDSINNICYLLQQEFLDNTCIRGITELISKLRNLPDTLGKILISLNLQLVSLAIEVKSSLQQSNSTSYTSPGVKEKQLLRLCRIMKNTSGSFESIDFLWQPVTDALSKLPVQSPLILSSTLLTDLLPVLECFFICHYDRSTSKSFQLFSESNHKIINTLIKYSPSLLSTSFSSLISRFPSLLDFENKRNYFRAEMREVQRGAGHDIIRLHVRRQEVFMDSYHQLKVKTASEMYGKLRIQFVGEEGLDAGGLTREWYGLLARAMFNPNYALFIPSANGVSFQPNSMSSINTEHIHFFKFVGRIIGKALCDGYPLDLYFTRSFYKHILGQQVNYQDMEDLDLDFYRSLKSLMDINLNESELHEYYFAYEEEEFGKHKIKELVPEGRTQESDRGEQNGLY